MLGSKNLIQQEPYDALKAEIQLHTAVKNTRFYNLWRLDLALLLQRLAWVKGHTVD